MPRDRTANRTPALRRNRLISRWMKFPIFRQPAGGKEENKSEISAGRRRSVTTVTVNQTSRPERNVFRTIYNGRRCALCRREAQCTFSRQSLLMMAVTKSKTEWFEHGKSYMVIPNIPGDGWRNKNFSRVRGNRCFCPNKTIITKLNPKT